MKSNSLHWRCLLVSLVLLLHPPRSGQAAPAIFRGMCDASAVVSLGNGCFAVANDEDNILRVYSLSHGDTAIHTSDLSSFLQINRQSPEADLEGAAPMGDRVYWISSHGRNKDGKERPNRRRFFATRLIQSNGVVEIEPLGRPYPNLLVDLINDPRLKPFNLAAASQRAPTSRNALNIEGLCSTPKGELLIGFRNPVPHGKALIVPLLNPEELITSASSRFGDPLLLDLDGMGIRSLARTGQTYWIIAGSYDGSGQYFLYTWNGGMDQPRRQVRPELVNLNPEALECLTENRVPQLLILSDDGRLPIGGTLCKEVADPNMRYFRATIINL